MDDNPYRAPRSESKLFATPTAPPSLPMTLHYHFGPDDLLMYDIKINEGEIAWTPLEMAGVSMKVLHKDGATGAMAVLTRMDTGATIPAHFHTNADETVYVLAGDFVEDGVSYGPGSYFVGKAGVPHGPHKTVGGCTVLTHFTAELDFQLL